MKKLIAVPVFGLVSLSVIGLSYFIVGIVLAAILTAALAVPVLAGLRMFGPKIYDEIRESTYLQ